MNDFASTINTDAHFEEEERRTVRSHMRETAIKNRNADIITAYNRIREKGEYSPDFDVAEAVRHKLSHKYKTMPISVVKEVLGL